MTDLSHRERAALQRVGVDPDKQPPIPPESPPDRTLDDLPEAWRRVIAQAAIDCDIRLVTGLFDTPQPDLENSDGSAMTPSEWLAAGGGSDAVVEVVRRFRDA